MVSIKKEIYYLLDFNTHEFFFYDSFIDARQKEAEFKRKYGPKTITLPNGNILADCNPIIYTSKTLKHYYGTVFVLYKWIKNGFVSYIEGRKKEIDKIKKYNKDAKDLTLKKIVLQSYEDFKKKHGFSEDNDSTDLDSLPSVSLF